MLYYRYVESSESGSANRKFFFFEEPEYAQREPEYRCLVYRCLERSRIGDARTHTHTHTGLILMPTHIPWAKLKPTPSRYRTKVFRKSIGVLDCTKKNALRHKQRRERFSQTRQLLVLSLPLPLPLPLPLSLSFSFSLSASLPPFSRSYTHTHTHHIQSQFTQSNNYPSSWSRKR